MCAQTPTKLRAALFLTLFVSVAFTACSRREFSLENFLPKNDTWLFASLSTEDAEMAGYAADLLQKAALAEGKSINNLAESLAALLLKRPMSLDLAPLNAALAEGARFAYASTEAQTPEGQFVLNYYVLAQLKNQEARELLRSQLNTQGIIAEVRDGILIAASSEFALRSLQEYPRANSLAKSGQYKKLLRTIENKKFMYGVIHHVPLSYFSGGAASQQGAGEIPNASKASLGSTFSLTPGADGIQFNGYGAFDEEALEKMGMGKLLEPQTLTLFYENSIENPIILAEGFGLNFALQPLLQLMAPGSSSQRALQDIVNILQNHTLISVQNKGGTLPAIELHIDVGDDAAAQKSRDTLLAFLRHAFIAIEEFVSARLPEVEFIDVVENADNGVAMTARFTELTEATFEQLPLLLLFGDSEELAFGQKTNGDVYLSILRMEPSAGGSIKEDKKFSLLAPHIQDFGEANVTYIDGEALLSQVTRFIDFVKNEGKISADEYASYQTFARYAAPLKAYIQGTRREDNKIFTKGFLLVE